MQTSELDFNLIRFPGAFGIKTVFCDFFFLSGEVGFPLTFFTRNCKVNRKRIKIIGFIIFK